MKINKYNSEGYNDPTTYSALMYIEKKRKANIKKNFGYRPLVFICSPFAGDIKANIKNARKYSTFAVERNCIPFAPHLLFPQFLDDNEETSRQLGIYMGKVIMKKCNELWVFGGNVSNGMKLEIEFAKSKNMLIRWFDSDYKEVCEYA